MNFDANKFNLLQIFNNYNGKTSCTKTIGIFASVVCIIFFIIMMLFYMFNLPQADIILQFMDKIMTMFGFSVGLLGIKTITSNIGGNKVVIEGAADENGKQTNSDKKPKRDKFAEAAEMDDDVVDA